MSKETETNKSHIELLNELIGSQGTGYLLGTMIIRVILQDENIKLSDSDREFLSEVGKVFEKLVGYRVENIKKEVE